MFQLPQNAFSGFGPDASARRQALVKLPTLPDHPAKRCKGKPGFAGLGLKGLFDCVRIAHGEKCSVFFHTSQCESSHSLDGATCVNCAHMTNGEVFLENLLGAIKEAGLSEAEVSLKAGLNRRAVTDLREKRVRSPKLSTVFALSEALNRDPAEMMGLAPSARLRADLVEFLARHGEEDQARFLAVLEAVTR